MANIPDDALGRVATALGAAADLLDDEYPKTANLCAAAADELRGARGPAASIVAAMSDADAAEARAMSIMATEALVRAVAHRLASLRRGVRLGLDSPPGLPHSLRMELDVLEALARDALPAALAIASDPDQMRAAMALAERHAGG